MSPSMVPYQKLFPPPPYKEKKKMKRKKIYYTKNAPSSHSHLPKKNESSLIFTVNLLIFHFHITLKVQWKPQK